MRTAFFNTKRYEREIFGALAGEYEQHLDYFEPRLTTTTVGLARGYEGVCVFVNDELPEAVLEQLAAGGTRLIALRCAGFNNVDLAAAGRFGLRVVRVPAYSPESVAEHAAALIMTLNRKVHKAYLRVREANMSLDGLMGFGMHGKTAGVVGTGRIGLATARILKGFGCRVIAYDVYQTAEAAGVPLEYVSMEMLLESSDIISLHCPLSPATRHMINDAAISRMKPGVMLINTSRGLLIDTKAVIRGLKCGRIGYLGLDVYEEEGDLFFRDLSDEILQDDVFARLLTFTNVLITGHQGFFTREALENIARTTLSNIRGFESTSACLNEVTAALTRK